MVYYKLSLLLLVCYILVCISTPQIQARAVPDLETSLTNSKIRSDVVVTHDIPGGTPGGYYTGPMANPAAQQIDEEPGWMRRQLIKMGEYTSSIGNALGAHTTKISNALDKVCELIKTIIPVIAAVCHVGEFEFCSDVNEAPQDLAAALSPDALDLAILDK